MRRVVITGMGIYSTIGKPFFILHFHCRNKNIVTKPYHETQSQLGHRPPVRAARTEPAHRHPGAPGPAHPGTGVHPGGEGQVQGVPQFLDVQVLGRHRVELEHRLRQGVEAVDCCKDLATLLGQQGFCRPPNRLTVVYNKNLEAIETSRCVI